MSGFKVVNTTRKGNLVALELRHDGQIPTIVREHLRGHDDVLRVVPGNNPTKLFVLTAVSGHARNNEQRAAFVDSLSQTANAAA